MNGEVAPIDGAHKIAWLGTRDCYEFFNEVDVAGAMAAFWEPIEHWEDRQDNPSAPEELSNEIRELARNLVDEFG